MTDLQSGFCPNCKQEQKKYLYCTFCNGSGIVSEFLRDEEKREEGDGPHVGIFPSTCPVCDGKGSVWVQPTISEKRIETCDYCEGHTKKVNKLCDYCMKYYGWLDEQNNFKKYSASCNVSERTR
tara:strand:- start:101 stop:472 length:372 start_codon:yes stop_codon:yes gene_type:complete